MFCTTFSVDACVGRFLFFVRRTTRGGKVCPFFVTEQRKGERKSAKGPNALWIPAVRHEETQFPLIVAQKPASSALAFAS